MSDLKFWTLVVLVVVAFFAILTFFLSIDEDRFEEQYDGCVLRTQIDNAFPIGLDRERIKTVYCPKE